MKCTAFLSAALVLFHCRFSLALSLEACPEEIDRAAVTMSDIFRQWPLRPSGDPAGAALQDFTDWFAERAQERDHRKWRTHIVRDSKLNAFSIGDGHIFVTEGMLRFIDSEGELAALLAHEFAHHVAGHFCPSKRRQPGFARRLFRREKLESDSVRMGSMSASVDVEKEQEADQIGAVILEHGGFNSRLAVLLAARLSTTGTLSHFQYGERLEALQTFVRDRIDNDWDQHETPAFQRLQDAMLTR